MVRISPAKFHWAWATPGIAGVIIALTTVRSVLPVTYPVLGHLPAMQMTSHRGAPVATLDLLGHPTVVNFIFTSCQGTCPTQSQRMRELQDDAPHGTRFVSITVDPERDTPDRLAKYASQYSAGPGWVFLTGEPTHIRAVIMAGFKLPVGAAETETPAEYAMSVAHSDRFVLVDAKGRIRGYYSNDEDGLDQLRLGLKRAAKGRMVP